MKSAMLLGVVSLALIAFPGCSVLPETKASTYHFLPPPEPGQSEQSTPAVDWTLKLDKPQTSDALNSRRIMVATDSTQLEAWPGARWVSPAPALWRGFLAGYLNSGGQFPAVTTDYQSLQADFELSGTLQAFQLEQQARGRQVKINYEVYLVETTSRKIVARSQFVETVPVAGNTISAVVEGFVTAATRLADKLQQWLLAQEIAPADTGDG